MMLIQKILKKLAENWQTILTFKKEEVQRSGEEKVGETILVWFPCNLNSGILALKNFLMAL